VIKTREKKKKAQSTRASDADWKEELFLRKTVCTSGKEKIGEEKRKDD